MFWENKKKFDFLTSVLRFSIFSEKALKHPWPGSDADLFMSRTYYIELSTRKFWCLNQLGTPISIWNGSAVL